MAATDPDCLFCRFLDGTVATEVVASNDGAIAIRDINPVAPVHLLVIPRTHVPSLHELTAAHADLLVDAVALAQEVARMEGVEEGYGVATNVGTGGGQTIFHLHFHVVGGALARHLSGGGTAM